ncbi:hypothetical protein GA0074692_4460 [Micromonospora pallida]|uniref:Uncharacterized protein n=1 Tax=Micromonospora pallida TaxID=145854 RepID=A0A1C6T4S6_9ACTN|nr:hypothetical protein [Micromonospora pallida]SCL36826.1 hypothetical protein GA0074692_4460 [Micromonospora pallida]
MKATHNPPTGEQDTPAVLLRCAALYLSRHGWHQGTYYTANTDTLTPPACAVGAIGMAAAGRRTDHFSSLDYDTQVTYRRTVNVFTHYLDTHHPLPVIDEDGFLVDEHTSPFSWNDDPARTVDEVIKALIGAADEWDRLHPAGGAR